MPPKYTYQKAENQTIGASFALSLSVSVSVSVSLSLSLSLSDFLFASFSSLSRHSFHNVCIERAANIGIAADF